MLGIIFFILINLRSGCFMPQNEIAEEDFQQKNMVEVLSKSDYDVQQ